MPQHSTHSPINVICCADGISRSFAPVHSALGLGQPPPHDACCPLHSPQLNADNVTKPAQRLPQHSRSALRASIWKEELLPINLVACDGSLPFWTDEPIDEGLALLSLHIRVFRWIYEDDAILVEQLVVAFD